VTTPSLKGWDISALTYSLTYGPLAHRLDSDVLGYLDGAIRDAVIVDLGCGPGIVTRKFIDAGARQVIAVDVSSKMLEQVGDHPRIVTMQATMESYPFNRLVKEGRTSEAGVDVILFKRSLYMNRATALEILRNSYSHLNPGGCIVIVHPERSLRLYAFGKPPRLRSCTVYHLFNRTISRLAVLFGMESYTLHTREELISLAADVAGEEQVRQIPSGQRSFNLLAIHRPRDPAPGS
jgi:SAM-dependent methyltransferase